jgi:carbonic anhydrase
MTLAHGTQGPIIDPIEKCNASKIQQEILAADKLYAAKFGNKNTLTMYSAKKLAILTCMDSRIDPAKIAGLTEGDAFVIRNAGGRATDDAIRSLIISSKMLGTNAWFVIQHTDCGMEMFNDTIMRNLLEDSLETAIKDSRGHWHNTETGNGSKEGHFINWLTINGGLKNAVVEDVRRIRNHPLVSKSIPIYGYIYNVSTGKLAPVTKAIKIGAAQE